MDDILCHREQRYVGAQLTLSYDRRQIILEQTELTKGLAGQYVELYDYTDRPLEVRWKGKLLPYRVFRKDQRVTHAAVVENKRLGHALAIVKAQQDQKLEAKGLTNSEKAGYKKRPRNLYGPEHIEKKPAPAAVEMWNRQKTAITHIPTARRRRLYNDLFALHSERQFSFAPTLHQYWCNYVFQASPMTYRPTFGTASQNTFSMANQMLH